MTKSLRLPEVTTSFKKFVKNVDVLHFVKMCAFSFKINDVDQCCCGCLLPHLLVKQTSDPASTNVLALFLNNASLHCLCNLFLYLFTFLFISCAGLECAVHALVSEDDQQVPICFPLLLWQQHRSHLGSLDRADISLLAQSYQTCRNSLSLSHLLDSTSLAREPSKRLLNMPKRNHQS